MEEDLKNLQVIISLSEEEIKHNDENITAILDLEDLKALENLLTRYKQLEIENENLKQAIKINQDLYEKVCNENKELEEEKEQYKNDYYSLVNKIENKIDKFDYEFEKAKRKKDKDRADYYWDLIINFKKLLGDEK